MKRIMLYTVIGLFTIIGFGLTSCDDNSTSNPKQFKVRMTDSPGNYSALNMTITGVDAYREGYGWVSLSSYNHNVNIASLTNGNEVEIANASKVDDGHYTRLKIKFSGTASLVVNSSGSGSGLTFSLIWTSPQDVEVIIDQQINGSTGANILLDFDISQSIVESGSQYTIHPFITVVQHENTGVKGKVQGATTAVVVLTGSGHTYSSYINSSGDFTVRGMTAGTYTCVIYKNSDTNEQQTVNNVVVTDGQFHDMGTIQF
jgi:hypothetical protein